MNTRQDDRWSLTQNLPELGEAGSKADKFDGDPELMAERQNGVKNGSVWSALRRQLFDPGEWLLLRFALLHRRAGRAAAAEGTYRKLLNRHPDQIEALIGLGGLLLRRRRYDEAVAVWQRVAALRPHASGPAFQLARALHRSGELEGAAAQYRRVIELDPIHEKAATALDQINNRLARSAHTGGKRGKPDPAAGIEQQLPARPPVSQEARRRAEASARQLAARAAQIAPQAPDIGLAQFNDALRLAPDLPEALRGVATCAERLGLVKQAAAAWNRLATANPDAVEPRLQRDRLYALLEKTGAPAPFETKLRQQPQPQPQPQPEAETESIDDLLRSARSAYSQGRLDDAEAACQRVLALDGHDPNASLLLSRLYLRQRKWAPAAVYLTQLDNLQPDCVEIKERLARALLQDSQFEAAARVYEDLVKLQPERTELLSALAQVHARSHNWDASCKVYARLVEREPTQPQPRLAYARALQQAGNTGEAEAQLEAVLTTNPREGDALALLGRLRSRSDPDGAFECWSRLAVLNTQAIEPPLQMARIRIRQGRSAEARQFFQAVLDRDANHAEALAGFGHALAQTDRGGAIRHFTAWSEREPSSATPRLELARLYQKAHEWDRVEEIYREILEHDPHHEVALSRFAQLLTQDPSRIDHALDLWRRIGERDSAAAFPFVQRAALLERARRLDDAHAEYRAALDCAPDDQPALMGLARLSSTRMRWQEAAELFAAVDRLAPGRIDALLGLGRSLEQLDRGDDALDAYRKVLALEPANGNALLYRGRLLRQLGRVEEAIEAWRAVCTIAPQNADAWHELVFMLASAEREPEAMAALDAAEAAFPDSPQSWIRLGLAAQAGQFHDRAVGYFHRAIAAEPHEAGHQAQLGLYYLRQGIVDGAFHHLLASRELKPADVPVTKRLVETVQILKDLGIDPITMDQSAPQIGAVLVPERLFGVVREIADNRIVAYDPIPRRVIAVSSSLAAGGAERQLVTMLRGLSDPRLGLDLALFCISLASRTRRDFFLPALAETSVEIVTPEEGSVETYLRDPEVAPYARLIRRFPADMVGPIAFWLREFRRRRPQVVHAWQDSTNMTASVAGLLAGVPRIILCSRSIRPNNPRRTLRRFMQTAYQAVAGHPTLVLTNNSRAGANDHADWLGLDPARIEVVYNGIDFGRLEQSIDPAETRRARDSLGIPPGAPVLGSAFRMSEEKRPLLWVEVAAEVAKQEPRAHFIVCGDGPMRTDMLERAAALGIRDRLHLPGPQSNIASWYKAMDVVMLTSRFEGLPNVPLEAQSLGIPVVVTAGGGMGETVRQGVTGWTVSDAAASAIAERVLFCLRDAGWAASAAAAAPEFVKERFGVEAMLRRNLEIYGIPLPDRTF